jgi:FkbM family methyltransferase
MTVLEIVNIGMWREGTYKMTARTFRFPGSLLYYLIFGLYLSVLAMLSRTASQESGRTIVESLHWTDLSAYLSWIMRHLGLPSSSRIVLEGRLLGMVGIVEPTMSEFLKLKHGHLFVDVGAYHGHYSLLLSKNFRKIIAIEPFPVNADFLKAATEYRKVNNISVVRVAASDKEGTRKFRIMPQPSESRLVSEAANGNLISVQTTTLDSLLQPYEDIDLVKLDVEGSEFDVLKGATKSMPKIRSWLIELHEPRGKSELEARLAANGYGLQWVDPGHLFAFRKRGS